MMGGSASWSRGSDPAIDLISQETVMNCLCILRVGQLLLDATVLLMLVIMYLTNYFYEAQRQDSNLGPKPLSLLEFET